MNYLILVLKHASKSVKNLWKRWEPFRLELLCWRISGNECCFESIAARWLDWFCMVF